MAGKLECPFCSTTLKEEGDEMKSGKHEYRVYDNLCNAKSKAGEFRVVQCLFCYNIASVSDFK